MNWVDIVILVVVAVPTLMGWRNGIIRLVSILMGMIVGLYLAGQFFKDVAPAIPVGESEGLQQLIAFAIIVVVVMVVAWVIVRAFKTVLTVLFLEWIDGLVGAMLGLLLGAFAATAFVSAAGTLPSNNIKEAVAESSLSEPLSDNLGIIRGVLPDEFDAVEELLDTGKGLLNQGQDLLNENKQLQEAIEQGKDLLNQNQ